jgi:membrane associated rhomboid family serine protease
MNNNSRMNGLGGFSLFPPVLKALLIINIAVFFVQYFLLENLFFSGVSLNYLFEKYFAVQPIDFSKAFSFSSEHVFLPWQLISYQFMHGNLGHLFFNLFALWMFGSELENVWGSKKFLIYYLASGVGAAILHLCVSPFFGPLVPMVGASGSIFGILLGFGMTFPNRPIIMFPLFIPIKAKYFVMFYAGLEMIMGVTSVDGVAHFAHLGGALTGFLLLQYGDKIGLFQTKPKVYQNPYRIDDDYEENTRLFTNTRKEGNSNIFKVNWDISKKTKIEPAKKIDTYSKQFVVDNEIIPQSFIDTLLDKISDRGYQSLTDRERKILTEISKQI